MFGKKSVETLVVGAGPCGMLAALVLADGGNDVTIVDSAPRTCTSSNSAILHPLTLKVLERLGIAEKLIQSGYRIETYAFYDESSLRETFNLKDLPVAYPYALSIAQSELELFLEEELEEAGVHILWNHRVSDLQEDVSGLEVTVDQYSERDTGYAISHTERVITKTLHYQAKLVVAADGYNSVLRRMAGVEQKSFGEDQYFITFEFETDRDPVHGVFISIKNGLATAQQPIDRGLARLQFQFTGLTLPSRNREKERSYLQDRAELPDYLDEKHFNELVKERVPWKTGYINKLRYRAAIPFKKRYLQQPKSGNIFFLGDAARSFAPLGNHSLNLGLQEAEQLAHIVLLNAEEPKIRNEVLDQFGKNMAENWRQLSNLDNAASPSEMTDPWVAQNTGRILRALPATDETLEMLANQAFIGLDEKKRSQILL